MSLRHNKQVIQTSFLTLILGTSWPHAHPTGYVFMHPGDTQPFWLTEK
jgi:hypothetical protein